MHRLRIHIAPALLESFGPEIGYAWRSLLAGIGYPWLLVAADTPADIVYGPNPPAQPARIWMRADPRRWQYAQAYHLAALGGADGWIWPCYVADAPDVAPHMIDGCLHIRRDLIFDLFWLLSGVDEQIRPRNQHGHLDLSHSPWLNDSMLRAAPASAIGAQLESTLREMGTPPPLARWPYHKRAAAAASHDVDYPEVVRWLEPLRILRRQGIPGLGPAGDVLAGRRTHWHFRSWLELEQQLGFASAFYFVPRCGSLIEYALATPDPFYDIHAPHFRRLLHELIATGWEVGLHSSYNAYKHPNGIAAERARLESAAGAPVVGNRHHYYHLDPVNPDATLLAHEQAGLHYDASLTHDRYLGWRRGSSWPYAPFHRAERRPLRTLQLPTGWMDAHVFLRSAENPGDPDTLLRNLADCAVAQGGLLLVDIHDYVYDDALFPGWRRSFTRLFSYLGRRGDVWLARPCDIAKHWTERQAMIERASEGLI